MSKPRKPLSDKFPVNPGNPLYCIATVRRTDDSKPATDREAYDEIKAAIGLASPKIDDLYGAVPTATAAPHMGGDYEKSYLVLIKIEEAQRLLKQKHPNVQGIFHAAMVPSGGGPRPMTPEQVEQVRKFRRPPGHKP
jgi:hypothetical protein